jgi:hypothetical protein
VCEARMEKKLDQVFVVVNECVEQVDVIQDQRGPATTG